MKRLRKSVVRGIAAVGAVALGIGLLSAAPAAATPVQPILLTTEAQIADAVTRVTNQTQPFYQSWLNTQAAADVALTTTFIPEQTAHTEAYYALAREHSQAARGLAIAYRITNDTDYLDKAKEILLDWAADAALSTEYPGYEWPHSAGLVIGRTVVTFADAYAIIWDSLTLTERADIEAWFAWQEQPIRDSLALWQTADEICPPPGQGACIPYTPPWLGNQEFNNHLSSGNLGLLAIGYATANAALISEAQSSITNPRDLEELIDGVIVSSNSDIWQSDPSLIASAPAAQAGEIYDRYRTVTNQGLSYAHLNYRMLVLQAELAYNNGAATDWWAHVGPNGENLEQPLDYYADILLEADSSAASGYYAGDRINLDWIGLFEIAQRHVPLNTNVTDVLHEYDRAVYDLETFGWTLALTHGTAGLTSSGDPYPSRAEDEWEFTSASVFNDWSARNSTVSFPSSVLRLTMTRSAPGVVSPVMLGLDASVYDTLEVTLRNGADPLSIPSPPPSDTAVVLWATDDARTFVTARSVTGLITRDAVNFITYTFNLGADPDWTGRIYQFRFDPTNSLGPTAGQVDIESIRLLDNY